MLHHESSEDCGDIGFQTETDPGAITVYLDAKELARWAEVCNLIFLQELCLDPDCSFGGGLRI
jgi:hypothetical protein